MKIGRYALQVVCAGYNKLTGVRTKIYTDVDVCRKNHPKDSIIYGFRLHNRHEETPDWFDSIEDAVAWVNKHSNKSYTCENALAKSRVAVNDYTGKYMKG